MKALRKYGNYNEEDYLTPFDMLRKEVDSLFGSFPFESAYQSDFMVPKMDIYENENAVVVETEMPGVDKKDIKIKLEGDILSVSAEKKSDDEKKNRNFFRKERYYGKFERTLRLPEYIDPQKISAKYEGGVLEIQIEKKPEAQKVSKEITIQ